MKKTAAVVAGLILGLGGAAPAFADSTAEAVAIGSPGFLSGNVTQYSFHIQANVCGNTFGATGLLSPAFGNLCVND
ncbi:chaplin [Streptomyces sp. BK239]|uniref:chaplin n=1 Tax=Streptomyces sp. BK239 TaxID=2512155 RepID=UPI00102B80B2|nr:chaplin [Streptomyces sp. BK239]